MSSNAPSRSLAVVDDLPVPVDIRPIRTARRLRLRYDERRGVLKLTCPARTSRRTALAWATQQRAWVEAQIEATANGEPFVPGAVVPVCGKEVRLRWSSTAPRTPTLDRGELVCGGPEIGFGRRIDTFLRALALRTLSKETAEFASKAGLAARSVAIGDASTRWGSCTSDGRIRYSWRLILADPIARRYVVAHEVAHLAHLDHGPQFKALEALLFGDDVKAAQALLRRSALRLKRIGRGL
jgi:predicted metal-dependent hydrolase